jgi:acetoacetate decarboxylase
MKSGYSMPGVAPLYDAPPYIYQGNRSINVLFKTTPETLQALVPAPLVPNPDSVLFIYFAQFNVVVPKQYRYLEMGIGVPASFTDHAGQYAVYLYLDKTGAIVPGREIYGWPKKDAEISFTEEQNGIAAQVVRDNVVLAEATLHHLEKVDPIPQQPSTPWFNLKLIPSVKKNAPPDVMQLTSTLIESEMQEMYTGSATLKLGSSGSDPLGDIPILAVLEGRFTVDDVTLGYGDVIYDYLAEMDK